MYYWDMKPLNILFTISSFNVLLIIVERLSFTTDILLQPYSHIRLHELIQGPIFLTISVVLSFLTLRLLTNNFKNLTTNYGLILSTIFVAGAYLYGLGEGWHELASFTFNHHCNVNNFTGDLCGGLFINDYYTGNILFFIGGISMNTSLIFLELKSPSKAFNKRDLIILSANSLVYAFTWFAYAGFDRVLVGLYSALILMAVSLYIFFKIKSKFQNYPFITYSALAYALAGSASLALRILNT